LFGAATATFELASNQDAATRQAACASRTGLKTLDVDGTGASMVIVR
jgi:hypothetical protein